MKTILITGSTDGIGKLAAIKLAKDGHRILLHGRNKEKLAQSIADVTSASNNENIKGLIFDLSDVNNIRAMLAQFPDSYTSIDVLINNAGVYHSNTQQSPQGLDMRFAVNYLAPFILTYGILPLLEKADAPRVINLSSAAQETVSTDALQGLETLTAQRAYAQSKLALTMWSFYFSSKYPSITTIAVNPGSLLNTKMAQEAYGQHWSPAAKGAAILYDLAISESYANSNGKYFDNDNGAFNQAHPDAYDQQKIERLILETKKILKG